MQPTNPPACLTCVWMQESPNPLCERLAADVDSTRGGPSARLAGGLMAVFRALFRLNLPDSPLGWQVVAVARKRPDA